MQATRVDMTRDSNKGVPVQAEPFLQLPPEIYPKIYQRLPSSDVLQFAWICKTSQTLWKALAQEWASLELDRIILLAGEQRWTRFINLIAQCGPTIAPDRWQDFLVEVASQCKEEATLLQLAALSPVWGKADHKLMSEVHPEALADTQGVSKALWKFVANSHLHKWMARAACAALTGLWRYECRGRTNTKSCVLEISFGRIFASLPMMEQVKNLPCIEADYIQADSNVSLPDVASIRRAYALVCQAHSRTLHLQCGPPYGTPGRSFSFQSQSKRYLTCLANQFQDAGDIHSVSCGWISKSLTLSFDNTAPISPWREQEPEFTLLVFLALRFSLSTKASGEGLERRLIAVGFVTAQECMDLSRYLAERNGDTFNKVRQWLSLNRDKIPEAEQNRSCVVS